MRQTLILYARVESGHASRQKTGKICDFCLPDSSEMGRASKVDKNEGNVWFLSTGWFKFRARGSESRQKTGEMSLFCLPAGPNSGRAVPKVEQNLKNFEKCSTADSKFGSRGSESRTKSQKFWKMFYPVTFAKAVRSQITSKSQKSTFCP